MIPDRTPPPPRGLSLSEVTITLAIVGAAMVTVLGVISTGLRFHLRAEEQAAATFIAAQVFADLQLPLVETNASPDGEYHRFLDFRRGESGDGLDIYDATFSDLTDPEIDNTDIPSSDDLPGLCWVLDRHLTPVTSPSSPGQHLSDSRDVHQNGSTEFDAHYLVFVRTAGSVSTDSGSTSTELDQGGVLVMVSVESPASAPPSARRSFGFHRVITVR